MSESGALDNNPPELKEGKKEKGQYATDKAKPQWWKWESKSLEILAEAKEAGEEDVEAWALEMFYDTISEHMLGHGAKSLVDDFDAIAEDIDLFGVETEEVNVRTYRKLLRILYGYTTNHIQGHRGDFVKTIKSDLTKGRLASTIDSFSLATPGYDTYLYGIKGTGKTSTAVWLMLDQALRRRRPDVDLVIITNIAVWDWVQKSYNIHRSFDLWTDLDIISDYYIERIPVEFMAYRDEFDQTINAWKAQSKDMRNFFELDNILRKYDLGQVLLLHFKSDIPTRHRDPGNVHGLLVKGYWFPEGFSKFEDMKNIGRKKGLTTAAVWTEDGMYNLTGLEDQGKYFNTLQPAGWLINVNTKDLFQEIQKIQCEDNTKKAILNWREEQGHAMKKYLEKTKVQSEAMKIDFEDNKQKKKMEVIQELHEMREGTHEDYPGKIVPWKEIAEIFAVRYESDPLLPVAFPNRVSENVLRMALKNAKKQRNREV